MRRLASILVLALAATGGAPAAALAHAFLQAASPKAGARMASAPAEVRLTFSEPIEAGFSTVAVSGPAGFGGAAPARPAPGDHRGLAVALRRPLPAGRYQVRWRVLSVDSHVTQGSFGFEVAP
jgi:methionine-rich copper-binding protein CopC